MLKRTTYNQAFLLLVVLQIVYFSPVLLQGYVIYAHTNDAELAVASPDSAAVSPADEHRENRKFSDQTRFYVPEINQHLKGANKSWLATWTPYVQLGRPVYQTWYGKANPLTHLLMLVTDNPFRLYTLLTVCVVALMGYFVFLFLKELSLHPLACLMVAAGFSLGSYNSYWLTFVLYVASYCWIFGILWLIVRFIKTSSVWSWFGISVFTYLFLLMGYPQSVVGMIYVIIGFTLVYAWRTVEQRSRWFYVVGLVGASAVLGCLAALPVYLDLIMKTLDSTRTDPGDSFFLVSFPKFNNLVDITTYIQRIIDPFWFGNPIDPKYPFAFEGIAVTPMYTVIFIWSFFNRHLRKSVWPWQALFGLALLANMWSPVYLVMVHYLGFGLSEHPPLSFGLIFFFMTVAFTLDHLLKTEPYRLWPVIGLTVSLALLMVFELGWLDLQLGSGQIHMRYVGLGMLIMLGTMVYMRTRRTWLLAGLILINLLAYSAPMLLVRPLDHIHTTSPLTEYIQQATADGSRYAWIGDPKQVLLPNEPMQLGIKTVHSYDSLSSTNYQNLMAVLGGGPGAPYGRQYKYFISESIIGHPQFSYTGVGLILSLKELDEPTLRATGNINGVYLYDTVARPYLARQLTAFTVEDDQVTLPGALQEQANLPVEQSIALDDYRVYKVSASEQPTLLFISEQYHTGWHASSQETALDTVIINDFYLGVVVPPHTTEVTIQFRAVALFSWIPQVGYGMMGILLSLNSIRRHWHGAEQRSRSATHGQ